MVKIKAAITGVGGYLPEQVLTNQDLEQMVDTNDEWIVTRTGIKERRIVGDSGMHTSDLGVKAIENLLEKTGTDKDDIELLICATVTPDYRMPDTANTIADKLGMKKCYGFDINAACSGFLYALTTASKFIESGTHKKVIVVGAEEMSSIVDYQDRATCIIFGDGAAAVLLEPNEDYGVEDSLLRSDGDGRHHLVIKSGGSAHPITEESLKERSQYVYQEGRVVFKHAVKGMSTTIEEVLERNHLNKSDIQWLAPHQANKRIIDTIASMIDFPEEKVMINIHKYGNTTSATIPLCLLEYESQLKKGDKLLFTAFGGGFTWGTMYVTWAYDGE